MGRGWLPLLDLVFHGREIRHEPPLFSFLQHFVYMVNDLTWRGWEPDLPDRHHACGRGAFVRMIFG